MWKLCVPGSFDRQARAGTSSARESQGMLYQGHLDGTAGAWADVGGSQGSWHQSYNGQGTQLELVWARSPGYTEVALIGCLESLDSAPIQLSSWKGTKKW